MSDAELEELYSLRGRSATREEVYTELHRRSEALRSRPDLLHDLTYGATSRERIDVFTQEGGAPVFIFIHGGYWRALEKDTFLAVCEPFADRGFVAANVDYGLRPEFTVPEIVAQVLRAIIFIADNAASYGGRADRIVLCGHSAGGHMAAWAASEVWRAHGVEEIEIKAVIPVSGIFDLGPLRQTSINDDLAMDANTAHRLSPFYHLSRPLPPMLCVVGGRETKGFLDQTQQFNIALRAAGHMSQVLIASGLDHFNICQALANSDSAVFARVMDFMEAQI